MKWFGVIFVPIVAFCLKVKLEIVGLEKMWTANFILWFTGKLLQSILIRLKKPFFHFLPGTKAYSISTTGCNLQCKFCQNWEISQFFPWEIEFRKMTPEEVVEEALKSGAQSIAYTFSEPTVFYEYMYDIAKLAHKNGLKNIVVVSAGYINPEPLREYFALH